MHISLSCFIPILHEKCSLELVLELSGVTIKVIQNCEYQSSFLTKFDNNGIIKKFPLFFIINIVLIFILFFVKLLCNPFEAVYVVCFSERKNHSRWEENEDKHELEIHLHKLSSVPSSPEPVHDYRLQFTPSYYAHAHTSGFSFRYPRLNI